MAEGQITKVFRFDKDGQLTAIERPAVAAEKVQGVEKSFLQELKEFFTGDPAREAARQKEIQKCKTANLIANGVLADVRFCDGQVPSYLSGDKATSVPYTVKK